MNHVVKVRARNYQEYMRLLQGLFHLGDRELDVLECLHKHSSNYLVTKKTRKLTEEELKIRINNYISKLKYKGVLIVDEETGLYIINGLARFPSELEGVHFMLDRND